MHDLNNITSDFALAMQRRGSPIDAPRLRELVAQRKEVIREIEAGRGRQNEIAREIGLAKSKPDVDTSHLVKESHKLNAQERKLKGREAELTRWINESVEKLPNVPWPDVPEGVDETHNVVVATHPGIFGEYRTKHHAEIPGFDTENAKKLAHLRNAVLRGSVAKLSRALGQFMLDTHTANGYEEINVPVLVETTALFGTGQLPKFKDDLMAIGEGTFLAPTAEVMLTNLVAGELLDEANLPLRYVALTQCFRREVGSAGRDTRGILRQNQFEKVELVSVVSPGRGEGELELMTTSAESILFALELPFRRVLLCAGDMGFSAAKTYDLEVWMAGEGVYREVSSCSLCTDFQARRMKTRMKRTDKSKVIPYTLNGSGLAVGRTLAAVVEYYLKDDHIIVPGVLRPYLGGAETLSINS